MNLGRTLLFAPGDQPRRIARALASDADAVVLDLEDAVAERAKSEARCHVVAALDAADHKRILIRINKHDSRERRLDLDALGPGLSKIAALVLPKTESASQLRRVGSWLTSAENAGGLQVGSVHLLPILESARGVLAAADVAMAPRVATLMFGTLDLAADLGVSPTVGGVEFLYARSQLVLAARAAGLTGPIDGPHAALDDEQGLVDSCAAARDLGFTGRVVIHPRQIDSVHRAFSPSDGELEHARRVLAAYDRAEADGVGALRLPDGTFVDQPVVVRAAALLGRDVPERAS